MDYLLYYVAHVTIEYIRTAGLMAIMTMKGSGKRKWRKWSLAIVLGALIAEVWTVALMDVTIPRDGSECQMVRVLAPLLPIPTRLRILSLRASSWQTTYSISDISCSSLFRSSFTSYHTASFQ